MLASWGVRLSLAAQGTTMALQVLIRRGGDIGVDNYRGMEDFGRQTRGSREQGRPQVKLSRYIRARVTDSHGDIQFEVPKMPDSNSEV
jgi:hypothetical protein